MHNLSALNIGTDKEWYESNKYPYKIIELELQNYKANPNKCKIARLG